MNTKRNQLWNFAFILVMNHYLNAKLLPMYHSISVHNDLVAFDFGLVGLSILISGHLKLGNLWG